MKTSLFLMLAGLATSAWAEDYTFRLKNELGFARTAETVEVEIPTDIDLKGKRLADEQGHVLPYETCGQHGIRFQASVAHGTTMGYVLTDGNAPAPEKRTYAAVKSPTSRADIAWENDRAAFRMYSSVLLANEPNTGNGVDLWAKKKDTPVVDAMYGLSNYHAESAYGVDAFSVNGKRLGCGGVSHVVNGKLVVHAPHDECVVEENGALQSRFRLTYHNLVVDGVAYTKTLDVTTTAGSLLNKATVCYTPVNAGTGKPLRLAVALYQHTDMSGLNHGGVSYDTQVGLAGWAENKSEGSVTSTGARFYQGCYVPSATALPEVIDHHLCVCVDYTPGTELTYYFGGGWSAFPQGEYTCDEDWFDALDRFKAQVDCPLTTTSWDGPLPQKDDVIALLNKANLYWQQGHPTHGDHFWNRAVYHTGNMEAYKVTADPQYLDYSLAWAERNRYWGQTGTDKSRWKFSYGESADYVLFGDNQICFQIYADLYSLLGGEEKIARAREVMEYEMSTSESGYLWWVDGLYMVMPVMTKLYNITGNALYLEKMYEYWRWGTDLMWDEAEGLYYRDGNYVYPKHKTAAGGKDFWARGDGWIFAAFARVLDELPADDPHRQEYIAYYRRMAESLRQCQRVDAAGNGYWCRSLLDEDYAPGYETSGTALFVFGFAWGINHGILDEARYGQVLQRGWKYLTYVALQADGRVGYVQPIGSNAAPGTYISASQTADFGVGAFLLAASEMSRYAAGEQSAMPMRVAAVELADANVLRIAFNMAPDAEGLENAAHYLIDGEPVQAADIAYDGAKTVVITLGKPLDYGCYQFRVEGIRSMDGAEIAAHDVTLIRTVPLTPNTVDMAITAIGAQSGNPAANVADGSYGTRWSQEGTGQWLQFDLKRTERVVAVDIAFYLGDTRTNYFDIKTSTDGRSWTDVLTKQQSSGWTSQLERYRLPQTVEARYVRIYCNGASTTAWNSILEARVRLEDTVGEGLDVPEVLYADILLPQTSRSGEEVVWVSSDESIMTATGLVSPAEEEQTVSLTAYYGEREERHDITVMPRSMEQTLLLRYDFEENDVYTEGTQRWLRDRSSHGRDAKLMNEKCRIDGRLNLVENTAGGFDTNGYVLVPEHLLDSLRSYTVSFTATPAALSNLPRFYDFGSGSPNSLFLRAGNFAAGLKYNGQTTTLIKADELQVGVAQHVAVTFDARMLTTTIYVDGWQVAQSKDIKYEPYQLLANGADTRNYIGRTQWWDTSSRNSNVDYVGTLDDFRIYGLCLTEAEVKQLMQEAPAGIHMAQGSGETGTEHIYDLSGRRADSTRRGVYVVNGRKVVR
ncbi:MAG: glycoside hydrolase family 88 protein [Bacteroidaceae bacterium]|nr:glycoside hydrolase family 88 protein [Bacteroidaceae bacterium]